MPGGEVLYFMAADESIPVYNAISSNHSIRNCITVQVLKAENQHLHHNELGENK